jgi:hypothetical protein
MQCPWGINFRVPELGGDALFKPLGDEMFETLRLFMYLVDRVVQYLVKKSLDEPMVPHHFHRALSPRGG